MNLEKYYIRDLTEETDCDYCGYPFYIGDHAYAINDGMDVVCSRQCADLLCPYLRDYHEIK